MPGTSPGKGLSEPKFAAKRWARTTVQFSPDSPARSGGEAMGSCLGRIALAESEPPRVARRGPPIHARAQHSRSSRRLPRAQVGNDQRILEDLALRMAAADPWQIVERCLEQTCRLGVVAAAERRRTRAERGCYFARRQPAVTGEALQADDATADT